MALSQIYTAVSGDVITAARWNNEFGNIYNNGTDVGFPLTEAVSFAGFTITWDAAGATTMVSTASQGMNYTPGAKSGTPSVNGGFWNQVANTYTDTNTAVSGTAALWTGFSLRTPTLAATNATVTTTDADTLYIEGPPTAGTNETLTNANALHVGTGQVKLGGSLVLAEGAAVASAATTEIWTTDGNTIHITGTTTITSFGTAKQAGQTKTVIFDGALTLTHGANLVLPGAVNVVTAAGDIALVYADSTTQHDVQVYTAINSSPYGAPTTLEALTSGTEWTVPTSVRRVYVQIYGASGGGGGGGESAVDGAPDTAGNAGTIGGNGGTTSFNAGALSTTGGTGGFAGSGGFTNSIGLSGVAHGVGSGGTINRTGGGQSGGNGGEGGQPAVGSAAPGTNGGKGGDGGYVAAYVTVTPGATVTYAIGTAGSAGAGGTGTGGVDGGAGGAGQAGYIVLQY